MTPYDHSRLSWEELHFCYFNMAGLGIANICSEPQG